MGKGMKTESAAERLKQGALYTLQYGLDGRGIDPPCPACGWGVFPCALCGKVMDLGTEVPVFVSLERGVRRALGLTTCQQCLEKRTLRIPIADRTPRAKVG